MWRQDRGYRVLSEIGRGGMGVVYEAEQISLGRRVALKVLRRSRADESHSLERFQREARSAARLHHTNIVPVFEVGEENGIYYSAMQYIHGHGFDEVLTELVHLRSGLNAKSPEKPPSLSPVTLSLWRGSFPSGETEEPTDLIQDKGDRTAATPQRRQHATCESDTLRDSDVDTSDVKLPGSSELSVVQSGRGQYCRSIAHVGWQVADALTYAHARGVVHRDIKPSNLLLDTAGAVWIIDFGSAKAEDDAAGNSLRKYLYNYSMPDVLRNDPTYPKVQWNAFGATGKSAGTPPGSWDPVESKYYPLVDDAAALGFNEVMIDVGWWQNGEPNANPRGTEPIADAQDWPSGMKAAADYTHKHGMSSGLYWTDTAAMTTLEGRQLRANHIKLLFQEYGADIWRSDSTSGSLVLSNYWSVKGFYEMNTIIPDRTMASPSPRSFASLLTIPHLARERDWR